MRTAKNLPNVRVEFSRSDPSFRLGAVTNLDPILKNNGGQTPTHALLPGSNAIDAGSNAGAPATDQRGVARPQDGNGNGIAIIDIGAFELASVIPTSKDQCKNGGWMNFTFPRRFKNEGDCIKFVNTGK